MSVALKVTEIFNIREANFSVSLSAPPNGASSKEIVFKTIPNFFWEIRTKFAQSPEKKRDEFKKEFILNKGYFPESPLEGGSTFIVNYGAELTVPLSYSQLTKNNIPPLADPPIFGLYERQTGGIFKQLRAVRSNNTATSNLPLGPTSHKHLIGPSMLDTPGSKNEFVLLNCFGTATQTGTLTWNSTIKGAATNIIIDLEILFDFLFPEFGKGRAMAANFSYPYKRGVK